MEYVYLASPYSHPLREVRENRYKAACKKTAQYVEEGVPVFCPIAHTHIVADYMDESLRMDFDTWMRADLPLLHHAGEMHVLTLDGWEDSKGIKREMEYAEENGIPIQFIGPELNTVSRCCA